MRKLNLESEPAQLIAFRLPPSEVQRMDQAAKTIRLTRSEWIRAIILSSLQDQSKGQTDHEDKQ